MASTSVDALLSGRVAYEQPAEGYRVGLEAKLLARFAIGERRRAFAHAVDLGAGPGAIALMLAATGWATRATAVEPDALHVALATANVTRNSLGAQCSVVHARVETIDRASLSSAPDLVVSNPPWFGEHDGALAPDATRAASRALVGTDLVAFCRAARRILGPRGAFALSFPSARWMTVIESLAKMGLHPKRLRFIHPRVGREAQVVLVEAKPGRPGGLVVEPPLIVRGDGEAYIDEVEATLRGRWPTPA